MSIFKRRGNVKPDPQIMEGNPRSLTEAEKGIFFGNHPMWAVRAQMKGDEVEAEFIEKLLFRNLGTSEAREVFDDMTQVYPGFTGPLPLSLQVRKKLSETGITHGGVSFEWIEYNKNIHENPQRNAVFAGRIVLVSPDKTTHEMTVADTHAITVIESELAATGLLHTSR